MGQRSGTRISVRRAVVLSDDAGQFNIGQHGVGSTRNGWCINWKRSPTSIAPPRRGFLYIWDFYADLKAYQLKPGKRLGRRCAHASTASSDGLTPPGSPAARTTCQ